MGEKPSNNKIKTNKIGEGTNWHHTTVPRPRHHLLCPCEKGKRAEEEQTFLFLLLSLKDFYYFSIFLIMCICLSIGMYMKAGACGSQQRTLDPVELDFPGQEVTACGPLCSLPHAIHDCAAEKAPGVSSSPHRPHQKEELRTRQGSHSR